MPQLDPASEIDERGEPSGDQGNIGSTQASKQVAVPSSEERFDLHVSSDNIPRLLTEYLEQVATPKPSSGARTFIKDYLPVITPLAAVAVSIVVSYTTILFNDRATTAASSETLGKLVDEVDKFAKVAATDSRNKDNQPDSTLASTIAAMKIAVYGEQALPAVKMALGAESPDLRNGGVLIAQQMYRAETIKRENLTRDMLEYYDNPFLRRGVIEWLNAMGTDLLEEDAKLAEGRLNTTFGSDGKLCATQAPEVATDTAQFLMIHTQGNLDLALGLLENCPALDSFKGAREEAAMAVPEIVKNLPKDVQKSAINSLQNLIPSVSSDLGGILSNSILEIQKIK